MTAAEIKQLVETGETRFVLASGNVWAIVWNRATQQPIFRERGGTEAVLAQRWEQRPSTGRADATARLGV